MGCLGYWTFIYKAVLPICSPSSLGLKHSFFIARLSYSSVFIFLAYYHLESHRLIFSDYSYLFLSCEKVNVLLEAILYNKVFFFKDPPWFWWWRAYESSMLLFVRLLKSLLTFSHTLSQDFEVFQVE